MEADLACWEPAGQFELVSAHFLHSPVELPREQILRRAASVVGLGGLLLVVGHAESPPWSHHRSDADELPAPEEVLVALELRSAAWTVVTNTLTERAATAPDGTPATLVDTVLSVRRDRVDP